MINTTNFIRSPSPPKGTKAAMKTRSRKAGAADMVAGDKVMGALPTPKPPKDVVSVKRPR